MQPAVGDSLGGYRLTRHLGRGGMAQVFLAVREQDGGIRQVAIKVLRPELASDPHFITMLEDEARTMASIRHRCVVAGLGGGTQDGVHFIVMELVEGATLAALLRIFKAKGERLPLGIALFIATEVALGLQAAHDVVDADGEAHPIVHRDVSPHNILLSHDGRVKLIDFGVAQARSNSVRTKNGVIKGKLQYMSPEQAQAKPVDRRADIFSLGMTLYRMLTDRLPFRGQTAFQIYAQILRATPQPPSSLHPGLPAAVDGLVLRALEKRRVNRYQTAAELALRLGEVLDECHLVVTAVDLSELLETHVLGLQTVADAGLFAPSPSPSPIMQTQLNAVMPKLPKLVPVVSMRFPPALPIAQVVASPAVDDTLRLDSSLVLELDALEPTVLSDPQPSPVFSLPIPLVVHSTPLPRSERPTLLQLSTPVPKMVAPTTESTARLRVRWLFVAAAIIVGVAGGLAWLSTEKGSETATPSGSSAGSASMEPVHIQPMPDPAVTPRTTAPTQPAAVAPAPEAPRAVQELPQKVEKAQKARLTIFSVPKARVEIDGSPLRIPTPIHGLPLRAGSHRVTLIGPDGARWETRVSARDGRKLKVFHRFR